MDLQKYSFTSKAMKSVNPKRTSKDIKELIKQEEEIEDYEDREIFCILNHLPIENTFLTSEESTTIIPHDDYFRRYSLNNY